MTLKKTVKDYIEWYPDTLVHRVPKVSHFYRMFTEDVVGMGSACFSETVLASVPYSGGLVEVYKDYAVTQGILPTWEANIEPPECLFDLYESQGDRPLYYRKTVSISREYEWRRMGRMRLEKDSIKSVWSGGVFVDPKNFNLTMKDDEYWKIVNSLNLRLLNWIKRLLKKQGYEVETVGILRSRKFMKHFKADLQTHRVYLPYEEKQKIYDKRMLHRYVGLGILSREDVESYVLE